MTVVAVINQKMKNIVKTHAVIVRTFSFCYYCRIFSRRIYIAISGLKSPFSHIRLTTDLKEDMLIWFNFLIYFKGKTFWQEEFNVDSNFHLFTDSSGSVGFGAIWGTHWCSAPWPADWINNKVIVAISQYCSNTGTISSDSGY